MAFWLLQESYRPYMVYYNMEDVLKLNPIFLLLVLMTILRDLLQALYHVIHSCCALFVIKKEDLLNS